MIIRAVVTAYHAGTHTADVRPITGPAAILAGLPVLESCRPDLLAADDVVAVLQWSDVGGLVLGPWGGVPAVPPGAIDADTVDSIHADATPTASKLLAMDAAAKFPAHTVAGDLAVEGELRLSSAINMLWAEFQSELTIAAGEITVGVGTYYTVETQGGAGTDDLDTINGAQGDGHIIILKTANSARDTTVKDGTGNIKLAGALDCVLVAPRYRIMLVYDSALSCWVEISRST